jgi:hypothetical protein
MPGVRRKIDLTNGVQITTPLIIPSFSTRNVGRIDFDGRPESIASAALRIVGQQLTESALVSAFDLHQRHLVDSDRLLEGARDTVFDHPALLMVDSGLYETRERVGYDDAAASGDSGWAPDTYERVLEVLPTTPTAIVNFDADHAPFGEQIARARELFARHRDRASVMLLKPEKEGGFIDDRRLAADARDLRRLDIVAVTEKELGDTLLERVCKVTQLRKVLDEASVSAPLHVFGGLDPLLTPLYTAAGAEIVDGVGWLRYAYLEDTAHHIESRAVLDLDLDSPVRVRLFTTINRNLQYLRDLKRRLELLAADHDWLKYSPRHGASLDDVWRRAENTEGAI